MDKIWRTLLLVGMLFGMSASVRHVRHVSADYVGPNRTYVSAHRCTYTARLYQGGNPTNYYCTLTLEESSCSTSGKASYFTASACSWPASCTSSGYSCSISITGDTPLYSSYPACTATANFLCGTMGDNGWCRADGRFQFSASEPLSGYKITKIEGNYNGGNAAALVCDPADAANVTCVYNDVPQTSGTLTYWAVSTYGDTSAKGNLAFKYDATAPGVLLTPSGTIGDNGWYLSDVVVEGMGMDGESGLDSVTLSCGANPCTIAEDGEATITATARDKAGNTASTDLVVRKDGTVPEISLTASTSSFCPACGETVELTVQAADATSGLAGWRLFAGEQEIASGAEAQREVGWDGGGVSGGSVELRLEGRDVAGNAGEQRLTLTLLEPTPTPEPTSTSEPTATATPMPTAWPTATATATPMPTMWPTATATPMPTMWPTATASPTRTATPMDRRPTAFTATATLAPTSLPSAAEGACGAEPALYVRVWVDANKDGQMALAEGVNFVQVYLLDRAYARLAMAYTVEGQAVFCLSATLFGTPVYLDIPYLQRLVRVDVPADPQGRDMEASVRLEAPLLPLYLP